MLLPEFRNAQTMKWKSAGQRQGQTDIPTPGKYVKLVLLAVRKEETNDEPLFTSFNLATVPASSTSCLAHYYIIIRHSSTPPTTQRTLK